MVLVQGICQFQVSGGEIGVFPESQAFTQYLKLITQLQKTVHFPSVLVYCCNNLRAKQCHGVHCVGCSTYLSNNMSTDCQSMERNHQFSESMFCSTC